MSHAIIQASLTHLDQVVTLFDAYRVFYGQASDPENARIFLRERLSLGDAVILLALDESEALAFVQLYPSYSSVSMRSIWILNDLFVAPGSRRRGLGRALLDASRAYAAKSGALRVELATAKDNGAAKGLYESVGYVLDEVFDRYSLSCGGYP